MTYLDMDAHISFCKQYRYTLYRLWDTTIDAVVFLMLNPSTADYSKDDNTIKRCVGIAKANGFGKLVVVNLFAYRAKDHKKLRGVEDAIGPDNDQHIRDECANRTVICAWGARAKYNAPQLKGRPEAVRNILGELGSPLKCLRLTGKGDPWHPLLIPFNQPISDFGGAAHESKATNPSW